MDKKNKVEVRIYGKEFTLKGEEPIEYLHKVAHYVDKKMAEISKNSVRMSAATTAILSAVNLADDYFKLQLSFTDINNKLEEKTLEAETLRGEIEKLKAKETQIQLELAKAKSELEKLKYGRHN